MSTARRWLADSSFLGCDRGGHGLGGIRCLIAGLAIAFAGGGARTSFAQAVTAPYGASAVAASAMGAQNAYLSYLNLQGNVFGNLPQYQLQVQPFLNTQSALNQNSDQIQSLQRGQSRGASRNVAVRNSTFGTRNASALVTGHSTRFMTYSHYFPTVTSGRR